MSSTSLVKAQYRMVDIESHRIRAPFLSFQSTLTYLKGSNLYTEREFCILINSPSLSLSLLFSLLFLFVYVATLLKAYLLHAHAGQKYETAGRYISQGSPVTRPPPPLPTSFLFSDWPRCVVMHAVMYAKIRNFILARFNAESRGQKLQIKTVCLTFCKSPSLVCSSWMTCKTPENFPTCC